MDAKQVWRAVLGELQVSLSPANFETWLKDTSLVDLDENRYRIAAPNGFARDWLERHGAGGEIALLMEGPSAANPKANHRFEVIKL